MRILVVEDEPKIAALLRRGLSEEGHPTDVATSGEDALWMSQAHDYDAIVLDVVLPGIDGFETCRRMRAAEVWAPVLMLTARNAIADRVAGLDVGADDYLAKPFSFDELLARLRALRRRTGSARPSVVEVGPLTLDPASRRLLRVTIADIPETDRVLNELMGKDVEARFKFIMERAALADLDL